MENISDLCNTHPYVIPKANLDILMLSIFKHLQIGFYMRNPFQVDEDNYVCDEKLDKLKLQISIAKVRLQSLFISFPDEEEENDQNS